MLSVILKSSFSFCHLHSTTSRGLGENSLPKDCFNKHLLGKDYKIGTEIEKKKRRKNQTNRISSLIFLEYLAVHHVNMVYCPSHLIFFFNRREIHFEFLNRDVFAVFKKNIHIFWLLLKVRTCFFNSIFQEILMPNQHSNANWLFKLKWLFANRHLISLEHLNLS